MGPERGREAIGEMARDVVVQAEMKRRAYRGVVDVVYGGEKPVQQEEVGEKVGKKEKGKRKADAVLLDEREVVEKPLSKTQMKKRAKKARLEAEEAAKAGEAGKEGEENVTEKNGQAAQEGVNHGEDAATALKNQKKVLSKNGGNSDTTKAITS